MGRRATQKDVVSPRYIQGPPKRIALRVSTVEGAHVTAMLSTAAARDVVAGLLAVIDRAEADKVALRGDATPKQKLPKRDGSRGVTKARKIRPPSRLKRIETAARELREELRTHEGRSPISATILVRLSELERELGLNKPTALSL